MDVKATPYLVSFLVEEFRFVLFTDGRAFIHGTNDINVAKRLYIKIHRLNLKRNPLGSTERKSRLSRIISTFPPVFQVSTFRQ